MPLCGDLTIAPFSYIRRSTNFDPAHWERCVGGAGGKGVQGGGAGGEVSRQSVLLPLMAAYRRQHADVIADLMVSDVIASWLVTS